MGFIGYQILNMRRIKGNMEPSTGKKFTILDENKVGQIFKSNYVDEYDSLAKKFKFINDLDSLKHRYDRYNLYQFWDKNHLIGMCSMASMNSVILNVILKYFPEFDQNSSFFTNLLDYHPLFIDFVTVNDTNVLFNIKNIIKDNNYIIWLDKNCNYDQILFDSSMQKIETTFFIFLCKYSNKMPQKFNFTLDTPAQNITLVNDFILFNSSSVDDYIYKFGLVQFNEINLLFTEYNKFVTSFYHYPGRYPNFNVLLMVDSSNIVGILCYYNLNTSPRVVLNIFKNDYSFNVNVSKYNPIYLFNFIVHPNYRGKGKGTTIFNKLTELNSGRSFVLSVDKNNSGAIRLYHKLEFITIPDNLLKNNNKFSIMIKKN